MDIFHFNINIHLISFLFISSTITIFIPFLFFIFFFDFQFSFLDYLFIWRPIYNPSDPMADPQRGLQGDSSCQSDPPLRAPHFPQNHVGFNEGEPVLPLSRLHLHRSSQAGNEVGFSEFFVLFCNFQYLLRINWLACN